MKEHLAECLAGNRIYTICEGGINMFRKLFNGRRKFVTLAVLVAALGALSAWMWAQVQPATVPLRLVGLEGELSSIKVPVNGEWKDTGPIKFSLAGPGLQAPVGQLDPKRERATVVWPVSVSAPLLEELGIGKIDTILIGGGQRARPGTDSRSMVTFDFAVLKIPGLPDLIVANGTCIICVIVIRANDPFWLGQPGAELGGELKIKPELFEIVDMLKLARESFALASQFMHFPIENPDTFLTTTVNLMRQKLHQIVIYIPEFNSYQTAHLKGTATFRIGR